MTAAPRYLVTGVSQAVAGEPLTVHGDGGQSRCFCHVADVVVALRGLLDGPRAEGRIFNVGSTEEVTIRELAERVVRIADSTAVVDRATPKR
jgi:UDP-glucose 4-epimerase